ncbi:MAG: NAD(P)H-dependent oxidoreductase [Blastocatellia bacterium]|nr:NAD(P)H-dependent oxidoreductase [Blastocatellia bacterium]
MPKILAIAGSLREHAYSKRILTIAASGAREAGADVTIVDLRDYPISIYDNDIQDVAFDENASKLQKLMAEHEGFLFASPEYNGSIPGGFKNAIDWTSRANDKFPMYGVYRGKTAAIMTASPGQFGGLRCLAHLRGVLTIMGIHVLPMEIAVPFVSAKFDGESEEMTDEKTKSLLEKLGGALAQSLAQTGNG